MTLETLQIFRVASLTLVTVTMGGGVTYKGSLPDPSIMMNLYETYLKPYVLRHPVSKRPNLRTEAQNGVGKFVDAKVKKMKDVLQDDDFNNNVINDEETTIIEKEPNEIENKDTVHLEDKVKLRKYKKVRDKIKKALHKETVAPKVKKMIIKSVESLIDELRKTPCLRDDKKSVLVFRNNSTRNAHLNISWKEWQNLKQKYLNMKNNKYASNETLSILSQFHDFFSKIMNETESSSRYRISCRLIDYKGTRDKKRSKPAKRNACTNFKICSLELREFVKDFYESLNDTTVSVFRNYAAMYFRDANTEDNLNKFVVINVIRNLSDTIERRVLKIFVKNTMEFRLDEKKDRAVNVKYLKDYVGTTIENVNYFIKFRLDKDLGELKARLLSAVKQDIESNLDVDLGNLKRDFSGRICTVFQTCNGLINSLRRISHVRSPVKSNDIYVKLQLTFDKEFKNTLFDMNSWLLDSRRSNMPVLNGIKSIVFENYTNIKVTRTTISVPFSKSEGLEAN